MFIILFSTLFFLPKTNASTIGEIFSTGKGFIEEGNDIDETIDTTALTDTSDFLYNSLLAIGVVAAIIVAMILGIQFMWASAEEKAKVKEAILPFVVGCFVVFGSFTIWKLAVNIGNDAEDSVKGTKTVYANKGNGAQGGAEDGEKDESSTAEKVGGTVGATTGSAIGGAVEGVAGGTVGVTIGNLLAPLLGIDPGTASLIFGSIGATGGTVHGTIEGGKIGAEVGSVVGEFVEENKETIGEVGKEVAKGSVSSTVTSTTIAPIVGMDPITGAIAGWILELAL